MGQIKNQAILKYIALRIKQLREERHMTQLDLYNDTNVQIGRIENCSRNVTVSTLYHICIYFNITMQEFFQDFEG